MGPSEGVIGQAGMAAWEGKAQSQLSLDCLVWTSPWAGAQSWEAEESQSRYEGKTKMVRVTSQDSGEITSQMPGIRG